MTSLTALVSMYHNQFLNGRTQNIKNAIYDLRPQGSLAISFLKKPRTNANMSISVLWTNIVHLQCMLWVFKWFFPTKHTLPWHVPFRRKKTQLLFLDRVHAEMFRRFFQHLLQIFLMKLLSLIQGYHSY